MAPDPDRPAPNRLSYLERSVPDRIDTVRRALAAYDEHADLRTALTTVGVDRDYIAVVADLFAPVLRAREAETDAEVEQARAAAAQKAALAEAERLYVSLADRAEAAFRTDRPTRVALGLLGHERSQSGRFGQMRKLYDGAPAHEAHLAGYGVHPSDLAAGAAALDAAERAVDTADRRDIEKQDATDARDKLFEPLDTLYRDFLARAETALRGRPQLLELLGLRPR